MVAVEYLKWQLKDYQHSIFQVHSFYSIMTSWLLLLLCIHFIQGRKLNTIGGTVISGKWLHLTKLPFQLNFNRCSF